MASYDARKAEDYWSERLSQTDELAAVLSFALPEYLNQAYSEWETTTVLDALPPLAGLSVLDIGCGIGRVTLLLAQRGAAVTAFDNSQAMLDACRRRVEAAALADHVSYEKGSANDLPFADGTFDVVLCLGVLEHLPPEVREGTLREIGRVAKPSATVALVVNNTGSRLLASEQRYRMAEQQDNGYFVSLVDRRLITATLAEAGLEVDPAGSNLFHSLVRHLAGRMPLSSHDRPVAEAMARLALQLDLSYPLKGDLDAAFADQWILVARRGVDDA